MPAAAAHHATSMGLAFGILWLATVSDVASQVEPRPYHEGATAFVGANLVPMDGAEILADRTVLVRGARIAHIGARDSVELPEDATIVDASGAYLMPGLTDLHAHGTDEHEFPLWLAYGVTRVQYLNAYDGQLELAGRVAAGDLLGPRLFLCAGPVSGLKTAREARTRVAELAAQGFGCVKPYSDIQPLAFEALVAEGRARGIRTIGHVPRNLTWRDVLAAGPTAVAHAEEFLYSPIRDAADLRRIDSLMLANDVALIPTLTNYDAITRQPLLAERMLRHADIAAYSPVDRRYWTPEHNRYVRNFSPTRIPRMRSLLGFQRRLVKRLLDVGVTIGLGTDAGNTLVLPGSSVHDELAELVKAGLTPYQALRAATTDAAALLGIGAREGTVTTGASAELLLVLGNPLEDVANARLVAGVMVRGKWLPREELDLQLARTERSFRDEQRMLDIFRRDGLQAALEWVTHTAAADDTAPLRRRALNELAYQLWKIDDRLEDAVAVFEVNRALHSAWWGAHASLAEAYEAVGRADDALTEYRAAVVLRPNYLEGVDRIRVLTHGGK